MSYLSGISTVGAGGKGTTADSGLTADGDEGGLSKGRAVEGVGSAGGESSSDGGAANDVEEAVVVDSELEFKSKNYY